KMLGGLSSINEVLDGLVAEEMRLRGLTKTREELERTNAQLRLDIETAKQNLKNVAYEHTTIQEKIQAARTALRARQTRDATAEQAHAAALAATLAEHDAAMGRMHGERKAELARLQAEITATTRELEQRKTALADFYHTLTVSSR